MITRLLNLNGLYLGTEADLMAVSEDNPEGYWENQRLTNINDDILKHLGGTWDNPPEMKPGWSDAPEFKLFQDRFRGVVAPYEAQADHWGWKDPRNSLTLELWLKTFPDLKLVLCVRNPLEVMRSLSTGKPMRDLSAENALDVWRRYHEATLMTTDLDRVIVTHYESYFYDTATELERVMNALEMPIDEATFKDSLATVKRGAKHHSLPSQILNERYVPAEVVQYYNAICAHAGEVYQTMQGDAEHQYQSLAAFVDGVYEQNLKLAESLSEIETEFANSQIYSASLESELEKQREYNADLNQTLETKESDLRAQQAEFERQQARYDQERENAQNYTQSLLDRIERLNNDISSQREAAFHAQVALEKQLKDELESQRWEVQKKAHEVENSQAYARSLELSRREKEREILIANAYTAQVLHELEIVRRSVLVRFLVKPLWSLRNLILPTDSRRYVMYRRGLGNLRKRSGLKKADSEASHLESKASPALKYPPAPSLGVDFQAQALITPAAPQETVICTIVSKNYLAQARALMQSIRAQHGEDLHLVVLLVDELDGSINPSAEDFEIVLAKDLGIPRWTHFSMKYSVVELNTAVKPYLLAFLFQRFQAQNVIYFDPDIIVYSRLDALLDLLKNYNFVLTPHLLDPIDDGYSPSEGDIRQVGTYNLGFIALSRGAQWERMLTWWQSKLYNDCVIDLVKGVFVDQSWMDLLPAFFEGVYILRHSGYNVAYWNIKTRTLRALGENRYSVNDAPLVFFHFSGYSPDQPDQVSKHQNRFTIADLSADYQAIFADYSQRLIQNGYQECKGKTYAYGFFSNGAPISDIARLALKTEDISGIKWPNPYDSSPDSFYAWLVNPSADSAGHLISPYALRLHTQRPDLQKAFPDPHNAHEEAYARWFIQANEHPIIYHATYTEPIRQALQKPPALRANGLQKSAIARASLQTGVNIIGYSYSETGIGQVTRSMALALNQVGFPFAVNTITAHDLARKNDRSLDRFEQGTPYNISIFNVNADMTFEIRRSLGADLYKNRYNIGCWLWELATFPPRWIPCFDVYDEIWVPSRFIQETVQPYTHKPVVLAPITIDLPPVQHISRQALGLPEDRFIALFMFDANSIIERKNPWAVIEAYAKAFTPAEQREKTLLVMKVNNLNRFPTEYQRLIEALNRVGGILLDSYFDRDQVNALLYHSDAYISLHRSEGYGLTLAEAMFYGKPTIGTNYSANTDFMAEDTAYLVPYELTPLTQDYYPYEVGNLWADPDTEAAAAYLRQIYTDPQAAQAQGQRAAQYIRQNLSPQAVGELLKNRLDTILAKQP